MRKLFTQFKGKMALNRLSEDRLIQVVLEEMKSDFIDDIAMAQAKIDADGDLEKMDGLYLKNRVRRIKDTENFNQAVAEAEAIKQKAKEWRQKSYGDAPNHTTLNEEFNTFDKAFSNDADWQKPTMKPEEVYSKEQRRGVFIILILFAAIVGLAIIFS